MACFDFGKIAHRHDRWYQTRRGAWYDRMEKEAVAALLPGARDGPKLLDVGCGTGHWSQYLAAKGYNVTGVDVSEQMIQIARGKDIANSRFFIADGENLPFADNHFDVVTAITSLEFMAHPKQVLSEMVRCVKKPNGTLIIGTLNALSPYIKEKIRRRTSFYASGVFFSPKQVEDLLSRFGEVKTQVVGLVPKIDWLLPLSPITEFLSKLIRSQRGAFIVAKVNL